MAAVPGPGAASHTRRSALALLRLAELGVAEALQSDPGFMKGLNVAAGSVTYRSVAFGSGVVVHGAAGCLARALVTG